jgi:hypothetical protein
MDPWFLRQMWELHETENWLKTQSLDDFDAETMTQVKKRGFSDVQIADCVCGFSYSPTLPRVETQCKGR